MGLGWHSCGTTPSHLWCLVTPPRPAMLLWPDRMKICLVCDDSISGFCFELGIGVSISMDSQFSRCGSLVCFKELQLQAT